MFVVQFGVRSGCLFFVNRLFSFFSSFSFFFEGNFCVVVCSAGHLYRLPEVSSFLATLHPIFFEIGQSIFSVFSPLFSKSDNVFRVSRASRTRLFWTYSCPDFRSDFMKSDLKSDLKNGGKKRGQRDTQK